MPPKTTMSEFGSDNNCVYVNVPEHIVISFKNDTSSRFVDNPASQDTIIIVDTLSHKYTVYNDTINCRIDTIEAYRSSHKPYFTNKDSTAAILATTDEGYSQHTSLSAYHFENDSATLRLVDNPPWVQFKATRFAETGRGCRFYPRCEKGDLLYMVCPEAVAKRTAETFSNYCRVPGIVLNADSTALDSVFQWKIIHYQ